MPGYTVTHSIDIINEYCNNPKLYKTWQLKGAINDAWTHYQYGNVSEVWYNFVVEKLSQYIKK